MVRVYLSQACLQPTCVAWPVRNFVNRHHRVQLLRVLVLDCQRLTLELAPHNACLSRIVQSNFTCRPL